VVCHVKKGGCGGGLLAAWLRRWRRSTTAWRKQGGSVEDLSMEAAMGKVGPSKRWRSMASALHSSAPEQLPLLANAPVRYVSPACYDLHLDLHVVVAVVGVVVATVGWPVMMLFVALHYLLVVLRGVVAVDISLAIPRGGVVAVSTLTSSFPRPGNSTVSMSSTHHPRGADTVMGTHFVFGNGLKMLKIRFVSMYYIGSMAYLCSILCAYRIIIKVMILPMCLLSI
jgi:hypothetical protein